MNATLAAKKFDAAVVKVHARLKRWTGGSQFLDQLLKSVATTLVSTGVVLWIAVPLSLAALGGTDNNIQWGGAFASFFLIGGVYAFIVGALTSAVRLVGFATSPRSEPDLSAMQAMRSVAGMFFVFATMVISVGYSVHEFAAWIILVSALVVLAATAVRLISLAMPDRGSFPRIFHSIAILGYLYSASFSAVFLGVIYQRATSA